jgi:hypothetical protein|tara:strand:+ start:673 stop:906 length:234 start_codon:yes stop_codon:yes gene_type:complete
MLNKYIYLFLIFIFALLSSIFLSNKEKFSNIHTLSINESTFYPEACGNTITMSGSLGCPLLSEQNINTLISRGNNNI